MADKLRVAWFSPLNTAAQEGSTISAYVSDQLLPYLREELDITLFHNSFEKYKDFDTQHYLSASQIDAEHPFDIFFYQLEDRPESNFIRQFSGVVPGVTWFHDFLFTSHGPEPILNSPFEDTIDIFNSGDYKWRARGFEYKERERSGIREAGMSALRFFSREIAHSECNRRLTKKIICGENEQDSYCIPLPVTTFTLAPENQKRICFCGTPQIQHRAHKLFQTIADIDTSLPVSWLVDAHEQDQAHELIREFKLKEVEVIIGRTPSRWGEIVSAGGIAVHTLFSVYGQTGPYHGLSLAAGLPVLVSDFGGAEFLPDGLVFKIDPGDTESYQMYEVLHSLLNRKVSLSAEQISRFAKNTFSSDLIAEEIVFALKSNCEKFAELKKRWGELEAASRNELLDFSISVNYGAAAEELFGSSTLSSSKLEEVFAELGWREKTP